jgi:hypothetical protein
MSALPKQQDKSLPNHSTNKHKHTHGHAYILPCIDAHMHTCANTHMYTQTHTFKHIHIHTYTNTLGEVFTDNDAYEELLDDDELDDEDDDELDDELDELLLQIYRRQRCHINKIFVLSKVI